MIFLEIALNIPLNKTFTYSFMSDASSLAPEEGKRCEVLFKNRKMQGCIIRVFPDSAQLPEGLSPEKIKPVLRVLDKEPVFTHGQIDLSAWMSGYYLASFGECLAVMVPGGKRDSARAAFSLESVTSVDTVPRVLSAEQEKAVVGIAEASGGALHYLYGKTGSGKTEVFLQAAERALSSGKGVIYLVPEIALTHQIMEAVIARFGDAAAVLHSGITPSQKLREWRRILRGEARIVVGARSAVFAPVANLGLIIIDEEHDSSYKSGNTPRYHARQVAMYRAKQENAQLVMGSATPSVEAWHLMATGSIRKHALSERLSGGAMPEIQIVDLTHIALTGALSKKLQNEIERTLAQKRQVILFLNRRGFNIFFKCNTCGFELKCKNCSVPLTYHKTEDRFRCHYCGWTTSALSVCPQCNSFDVGYSGFGTEFIESEVRAKFPSAKVERIDTDTTGKKGELEEKIAAFKNGSIDILLGTQMVAKGLNFPRLKLVGVINADTGLNLPDFRASERTFALITQVAGRAGRFFPDGKVIVQTFSPQKRRLITHAKALSTSFMLTKSNNAKHWDSRLSRACCAWCSGAPTSKSAWTRQ
ncbi:MAG: primosomal protein N' [Treponemataceae bacterium]|nr:MAG: primosomal protein N' [Treponemataceae bacterium]